MFRPVPPKGPAGKMGDHALYQEKWLREDTGMAPEPGGDPEMIAKAVKLLWESKKPIIFAGDGTHWANASAELLAFAQMAKIPVVTRRIARGSIAENSPYYLDSRTGRAAIGESDIRLSLGMKIGLFDGWGKGVGPDDSGERRLGTHLDLC